MMCMPLFVGVVVVVVLSSDRVLPSVRMVCESLPVQLTVLEQSTLYDRIVGRVKDSLAVSLVSGIHLTLVVATIAVQKIGALEERKRSKGTT